MSAFVKQNLPVLLAKQLEHETDPGKALRHAFMATQEALCASNIDCEFSGSTAVVSFLHGRCGRCATATSVLERGLTCPGV